ncbi:MAG: lysylphosphatidylglycerol synthase transmembrane domain-containing protein [Pirellulales bacterium]|nr:lysylphosphatidylglycerol synthase transmembrane domain-containing protein [Pirellulales bacterium]
MCHLTNALQPLRKHLSLLLRIGLSVGLMAILLWRQDWPTLGATFAQLDPIGWTLGLAIFLVSQLLSAVRWHSLARPLGFTAGLPRFVRLYAEGMFFSLCLPSSIGGDVVKAYRLGNTAASRVLAACSVVADRLTGLCAVLVIGLAALAARQWGWSGGGALLLGMVFYLVACLAMTAALMLSGVLTRRLSPDSRLRKFTVALDPYHDRPSLFWRGIAWGVGVQGCNVLSVMFLGRALGLELQLADYAAVVPLVALATTLPISLNGVGVREGAMVLLLDDYGVSTEVSTTLALVWFTVQVAGGLLGGLVYALAPKLDAISGDASLENSPQEVYKHAA